MINERMVAAALAVTDNSEKIRRLIEACRKSAESNLLQYNRHSPTFLAIAGKKIFVIGSSFGSQGAKNDFYGHCRLVAVANRAEIAILTCESWHAVDPDVQAGKILPSQSPRRKECVSILLETYDERYFTMCPILRNRAGVCKKLDKAIAHECRTTSSGPASDFLPPRESAEAMVAGARQILMMNGLNSDGSRIDVMLN